MSPKCARCGNRMRYTGEWEGRMAKHTCPNGDVNWVAPPPKHAPCPEVAS